MNATNQFLVVQQTLTSAELQRQMHTLLPPSVRLDRFTEVTIAAIQNNPDVLTADKDSLYRACLAAARRGLLPDKREGALVIFPTNVAPKGQSPRYMDLVQFMPMVEGVLKEMTKAGIKAYAVSVFENDAIALWNDDDGQHVKHEPVTFGDQGKFVGVFAAAKTEDGRTYVEAMNLADIEQVRVRSKQKDKEGNPTGTWKTDFDRMAQKSALHRLRKRLPISDEDALQNLKDMEEQSDIDLSAGTTQPATSPANVQPVAPPPQQLEAPKQSQADEVLRPAAKPRRSRVLQGVVQQATEKAAAAAAPTSSAGQAPAANPARADTAAAAPTPQQTREALVRSEGHSTQVEPEYDERDIV
jgi:recombination protein RecT